MINSSYHNLVGDFKFIYDDYNEPDYVYKDLVFTSKEQLVVFRKLKELINICYKKHINFKPYMIALEFCLTTHKKIYINGRYYTFNLACEILDLHPDIMRLRLMYELYLQKCRVPLEYLNSDIKINIDIISEMLLDISNFNIIEVANYIYTHPSVTIDYITARFDKSGELIWKLIMRGYVIDDDKFLYFTGRNPKIKKINWVTIL
ncbi:MAG: hypothetical protein K2P99_04440 [Burkholderiales bacterium]|nr:hypothetical protein [Burkholderiales bacterium]